MQFSAAIRCNVRPGANHIILWHAFAVFNSVNYVYIENPKQLKQTYRVAAAAAGSGVYCYCYCEEKGENVRPPPARNPLRARPPVCRSLQHHRCPFWISIKRRKSRLVLDRRRRRCCSSSFTIPRLNDLYAYHTHVGMLFYRIRARFRVEATNGRPTWTVPVYLHGIARFMWSQEWPKKHATVSKHTTTTCW